MSQVPANPVLTSMNVSPTFLVSGLTTFQGSASATDSNGDALTFNWSAGTFSASGPDVSGTLAGDGPTSVQVMVSDGRGGSATDSLNVTVGTMAGNWIVAVFRLGPRSSQ